MNRDYFWLTKDQFARLKPLLPTDTRGKPRVDDRRVISGIVHVLKSGGRWVDAPAVYGPRKTLYNRFVRWAEKGVWIDMFHALASAGGPPAQVLIDSSAVKAHPPDRLEKGMAARARLSPHRSTKPPGRGFLVHLVVIMRSGAVGGLDKGGHPDQRPEHTATRGRACIDPSESGWWQRCCWP